MILKPAEEALEEADQAVEFYNSQRPGLGNEFLEALTETYQEIKAHPLRNPRVHLPGLDSDYHFLLMKRFPYQIIYRLGLDRITVVAIAHTSRRPGYWKKRQV